MKLINHITAFALRHKWSLIFVFSILSLAPYLWASLYVHPFADDWGFAQKLHSMGRTKFVVDFYNNWSGRYFANALLSIPKSHPEHSLYLYKLLPIIFILFLNLCIFIVISALDNGHKLFTKISLSVFITAISISYFIEPFSALYWNCASFYLPAVSFYLIFLALIIKYYFKNNRSPLLIILIIVLTFLVSGLVEIFIFCNLIVFTVIFFLQYFKIKKIDWLCIAIILTSFLGLYLSVFNSGVGNRMNTSHLEYSFIKAAIRASYDLVIFNILPLITSPVSLIFILFYSDLNNFVHNNSILKQKLQVNPLLILFTGLLCFYIFHALSIYGAGYSLQGRVQNISQLLFYGFLVLLLMNISANQPEKNSFNFPKTMVPALILILILTIFIPSTRTVISECTSMLPNFNKQMNQRYTTILNARNSNQKTVIVKALTVNPKTYYLGTYDKDLNYYNSTLCLKEMSFCFKINITLERRPDEYQN